jgi:hypothetical protein
MTAPRGSHASGDGSFARDAGTQTTKAIILVALAVLVGVLMLSHTSSPAKPVRTAATHHNSALTAPTTSVPAATTTTAAPPSPSTVKVLVFNGTTTPHGAGYFVNKLQGLGYDALAPEDANRTDVANTQIFALSSKYAGTAANIATALGLSPSAARDSLPATAPVSPTVVRDASPDVVVLVGGDIASQSLSYNPSSSTSTATGSSTSSG